MTTSPAVPPLTVVVVDNASTQDLQRLLHQVARTAPGEAELVVASLRTHRLPPSLARRVRRLTATSPEALDRAVLDEALAPRLVLVASAAGSVSRGWVEEIVQRAVIYRDVTTTLDAANGGFLLYPPGVTSVNVSNMPWLHTRHLAARGRGAVVTPQTSVSAVLIVKNEEDVLATCLSAVAPFVDEIVVYDTGSTDRTMTIATEFGAKLIEGYWDDNFGAARNRSLAHATGEWILQVDADEVIQGDPEEFRARLALEPADQMHLKIVSSAWQGVDSGLETMPVRIFRRGTAEWAGALHEYPRPLDEQNAQISPWPAPARLVHSGYELGKVLDRDKTSRNVDLARKEIDEAPADSPMRAELLSNFIRSLLWAGSTAEAMPYFDELLVTDGNPTAICMTGRSAVAVMQDAGKLDAADAWIDKLERVGESAGAVAVLRARRHLHVGDFEQARNAIAPFLDGREGGQDPWAVPFDSAHLDLVLADALAAEGDAAGAVEKYLSLVTVSSGILNLNNVLRAFVTAGRPLRDLAERAPEELVARSVREASAFHPSGALLWFEALHEVRPDDARPVVAGCLFSGRAAWEVALSWSLRARQLGLDGVCGLRELGENETMPVADRAMAWLVLAAVLEEPGASDALSALLQGVGPADLAVIRKHAKQHGLSSDVLTAQSLELRPTESSAMSVVAV